jgi:hypothetical protein
VSEKNDHTEGCAFGTLNFTNSRVAGTTEQASSNRRRQTVTIPPRTTPLMTGIVPFPDQKTRKMTVPSNVNLLKLGDLAEFVL